MSDTIKFDKKCIPTSEYVFMEVLNRNNKMQIGDILIPNSAYANDRLGFYKVLDVGETAKNAYGLNPGDFVVADRLAQCQKTEPYCLMKYVNVIARTNETNDKFSPLRNMVFVKDEINTTQDVGGVLVNNYNKKLNCGKVVAMNLDAEIKTKVPYEIGDTVLLAKGGDSFQVGHEHVFIYKYDMICGMIAEDNGK